MCDTSGVTQCGGHKVCVCHLQLCQTGAWTGTEYLENRYRDEQSGEKIKIKSAQTQLESSLRVIMNMSDIKSQFRLLSNDSLINSLGPGGWVNKCRRQTETPGV